MGRFRRSVSGRNVSIELKLNDFLNEIKVERIVLGRGSGFGSRTNTIQICSNFIIFALSIFTIGIWTTKGVGSWVECAPSPVTVPSSPLLSAATTESEMVSAVGASLCGVRGNFKGSLSSILGTGRNKCVRT